MNERNKTSRSTGGAGSTGRSSGFGRSGGSRFSGTRRSHGPRRERPEGGTGSSDERRAPPIPEPGENIRIIPLGGVEEIGRNMTVIEFRDEIIIVDMGFMFSDENTPGIDYILPNTKYLEERKHKIKAVIITHGHLDHIGAIPYIMPRIGNPPLYSRLLTTVMIKKRQEEFQHMPPLDIRVVEKEETIRFKNFAVKFFAVTHTIPDAMGIIIETPFGDIVHTGDLKLDHTGGIPSDKEVEEFKIFEKRNVLLLMADSTNVERPGFSIPEHEVHKNIEEIIKNSKGRLIIGTFASLFERSMRIVELAELYGKKAIVEGRSMKTNFEVARQLNLLKVKKETMIPIEEMDRYPTNQIVVVATGSQGEEFAALMRMANKSHKYLKINKTDSVVLSSSVIPGNERNVQKLKDNLSRQGAHIIHYLTSDVHSSGHANRDETAWIHRKIGARFFIPVHGYHYMLRVHADIARILGMAAENIVIPDNGMIIEIEDEGKRITVRKEFAPRNMVLVDGSAIGDIQDVVLRDRQMLAQDGIFVVIVTIDSATGKMKKSADLISRGFVYLKENQELLRSARMIIKKTVEDSTLRMNPLNLDFVRENVTETISRFLLQKTAKRPVVIPVIISI